MPSTVAYVPYYPDSRGNRLDGWTASEDQGGHILWLRGPEAVAMQILSADHTEQAKYGIRLVDKLCGVIEAHPTLQHVEIVVDVPGHDSKRVSFGSRVANTVAIRRGAEFVRTQAKSDFRPEAKNLSPSQRDEHLVNEFSVPNDVAGKTVLIVDDVFRSGTSMASVATTARSAGASTVFGLCGVRTMRR